MKILYVSQHYPPEMGALAARAAELRRHWAGLGIMSPCSRDFPIIRPALCNPNIAASSDGCGARAREGVNVVRTWLLPVSEPKGLRTHLELQFVLCVGATAGSSSSHGRTL